MEIKIDNLNAVLSSLNRAAADIPHAIEAGLEDAATLVNRAKIRQVNKTYQRAIPRGKNGKPRWKRSGAWLNGQSVGRPEPLVREIRDTGKAAEPIKNYPGGYAEKLASLPVSKDGVNRSNAAAAEAGRITAPQVPQVFEAAVRAVLRI